MAGRLRREEHGSVRVLVLCNPAKRNALDAQLCEELATAIEGLGAEGARVAVLTGEGDHAFSSGLEIPAPGSSAPAPEEAGVPASAGLALAGYAREMDRRLGRLIEAMVQTPVPLLAALNGATMGGALEVVATCDLRLAHPEVKLSAAPARLGIAYSARGLARLTALLGEGRARQLLLTACTIGADEALAWGLVQEVCPRQELMPRALALAAEMAELAPLSLQAMRQMFETLLRRRGTLDWEEAAALDAVVTGLWFTEDAEEGRRAFREKRRPVFKGR